MRPYQIAAVKRILWKIESSYQNKKFGKIETEVVLYGIQQVLGKH